SRCRQEATGDNVAIDAARAPLARDNAIRLQLGQMPGQRAPGRPCGFYEGAYRREALSRLVGIGDEVLQRPVQMPADGAVQVEGDGYKGKHGASGCSSTALGEAAARAHDPCGKKLALAKFAGFAEDRVALIDPVAKPA